MGRMQSEYPLCDWEDRMNRQERLRCNRCGKEICMEHDVTKEGVFLTEWEWGYFSSKDGERHSFCLCEKCYDRITETFQVPVQVEAYL